MDTKDSAEWMKKTNVYEVNVRQYTQQGTFEAMKQHLPRLRDMGVETLWFMPVTPIAQKNKKGSLGSYYAASDYVSINPEFGNLQDFKELVTDAHQQGFKVIIDWVANHTGWDHVWTWQHPDYYVKDSHTGDFKVASGMDDIIELNYDNPALREAMIAAMAFWIRETNIDGFRCDLASWVRLDFWIEAINALKPLKELFWLGEFDPLENPDYMQVFDSAYTWKWMHRTREFYHNQQSIHVLVDLLEQYRYAPGMKAWFTSNHDENSWNGTEYEKYGEAAKALAVFSCTWPGIPLIYNGQEMPNHKRLEFFEKDPIEWNGTFELHDFYKRLLQLHSNHPALIADESAAPLYRLSTSADGQLLAYVREREGRKVAVLLNLSASDLNVAINHPHLEGTFTELFTGDEVHFQNETEVFIAAWKYKVFVN